MALLELRNTTTKIYSKNIHVFGPVFDFMLLSFLHKYVYNRKHKDFSLKGTEDTLVSFLFIDKV